MIFFPPILSSSDLENTDCCAVGFKKYFNDSILCNSVCVCVCVCVATNTTIIYWLRKYL